MNNKILKTLKFFFLAIFIFQLTSLVFLLATPEVSLAADPIKFKPQIDIPGTPGFKGEADIGPTSIGKYISAIYKYAVGAVGILATVVMMYGGILWIMAGGNQERIGNAKSYITASITGLVLALASYMILNLVNPDLVKFKSIDPTKIEKTKNCCSETIGTFGGCPEKNNNKVEYKCDSSCDSEKYGKVESYEPPNEICQNQGDYTYKVENYGCCPSDGDRVCAEVAESICKNRGSTLSAGNVGKKCNRSVVPGDCGGLDIGDCPGTITYTCK